ncbi:MAG: helix-turn-helix transcriptional regulator [Streptosporangiales bacterium]
MGPAGGQPVGRAPRCGRTRRGDPRRTRTPLNWAHQGRWVEALNVHYQTVGYLERGEYSPSLYLALRLAAYFEVPVEVIFSTEPFPRIGNAGMSAS